MTRRSCAGSSPPELGSIALAWKNNLAPISQVRRRGPRRRTPYISWEVSIFHKQNARQPWAAAPLGLLLVLTPPFPALACQAGPPSGGSWPLYAEYEGDWRDEIILLHLLYAAGGGKPAGHDAGLHHRGTVLRPARPCDLDGHSFRVGSTVPAPKASTPEVVSTLRLAALGAELANGAESIKRGFPQAVMA